MKKLSVELVNTGTEILLGKVVNTNAAWIGEALFKVGVRVARHTVVPDGEQIEQAIREAVERADVVLVSGGLGPTSDDVTREALASVCGVPLERDEQLLAEIKAFIEKRGYPFAPSNAKQANVPLGASVMPNPNGTAPGLWMPAGVKTCGASVALLPGPPRELIPMVTDHVLPRLRALAGEGIPLLREYKMLGVGESALQDLIDAPLCAIPGLEVGYCARLGEVDVRLIGEVSAVEQGVDVLRSLASAYMLVPEGCPTVEEAVVLRLKELGITLATAESCTGGLVAKRMTDVPGASEIFGFGWVTYANRAKHEQLGVSLQSLELYGAVSAQVAQEMAEGALSRSGAGMAVSVTGIAGPSGGTPEKPVGTVWIGLAFNDGRPTKTLHFCYPRSRADFREFMAQTVLTEMLKVL